MLGGMVLLWNVYSSWDAEILDGQKFNHCHSQLCGRPNNENKSFIFWIVYELTAITRKISNHFVWGSITIINMWFGMDKLA